MSKSKKPSEATLLPSIESHTVELAGGDGLIFRKKILPLATIQYPKTKRHPGGPVTFDREYHDSLIRSFSEHAYDSVPLQLATADNAHNMLPERTAGEVLGLSHETAEDVDGPGLYATIKASSPEHAELLRRNPKLGVSPEIVEGISRVDGYKARRGLRHVLATLGPRVVGLGPWRAVSLSEDEQDNGQLIDLSTAEYEEIEMGRKTETLELSDADLDAALAAAAAEFGEVDDDETDPKLLGLSDDAKRTVIGLAAEHDEIRLELAQGRAELAHDRWQTERLKESLAGVPKHILDLAVELLDSSTESVLELSSVDNDGDLTTREVDAKDVVRRMVQACRGIVQLSDTVPGFGGEPPRADDDASAEADVVKQGLDLWDARSGSIG